MSTQVNSRICFNYCTSTILDWIQDPVLHRISTPSRARTWPMFTGRPVLVEDGCIHMTDHVVLPREAFVSGARPQSGANNRFQDDHLSGSRFPLDCPYLIKIHCYRETPSSLAGNAASRRRERNQDSPAISEHSTPITSIEDELVTHRNAQPSDEVADLAGITPMLASWPSRPGTPGSISISLSASHASQSHSAGGSSTPSTLRYVAVPTLDYWDFLNSANPLGGSINQVQMGSPNHTSVSALGAGSRNDPNPRVAPFGRATRFRGSSREQPAPAPDTPASVKRRRSLSGVENDATSSQQTEHEPSEKRAKVVHEESNGPRASTDHTAHPPSKLRNELLLAPLSSHYI